MVAMRRGVMGLGLLLALLMPLLVGAQAPEGAYTLSFPLVRADGLLSPYQLIYLDCAEECIPGRLDAYNLSVSNGDGQDYQTLARVQLPESYLRTAVSVAPNGSGFYYCDYGKYPIVNGGAAGIGCIWNAYRLPPVEPASGADVVSFSADSAALTYRRNLLESDTYRPVVWLADVASGAMQAQVAWPEAFERDLWPPQPLGVFPDRQSLLVAPVTTDRYAEYPTYLYRLPLAGGPPVPLAEGYNATLSPDGTQISFLRREYSERENGLITIMYVMPAAGGTARGLHQTRNIAPPDALSRPAWSPDGAWIMVEDQTAPVYPYPEVLLVRPNGNTRVSFRGRAPLWTPDNKYLLICEELAQSRLVVNAWDVRMPTNPLIVATTEVDTCPVGVLN